MDTNLTQEQLNKLTEIASNAIREKFDTRDAVTALTAIDDAIDCGLYELANDMAKDFLNSESEKALFRTHFSPDGSRNVTIFRVFDATVRAVIYDSINPRHTMAITTVS